MLEYWLGRIYPDLIQAVTAAVSSSVQEFCHVQEKLISQEAIPQNRCLFSLVLEFWKAASLPPGNWSNKLTHLYFFFSLIFWHPLKEKCMLTLLHLPLTEQTFKLWSLLIFSIPMHNWVYKVKIKCIMGKNIYNELQLTELKPVI